MFTLFVLTIVALTITSVVAGKYAEQSDDLFVQFKKKYSRNYKTPEEEARRKQIFAESMARVDRLNELNGSPAFGVTKFSDWSRAEFKVLNGAKKPKANAVPKAEVRRPHQAKEFGRDAAAATATTVNWAKMGMVTTVKNQGQCGSCWAFSTAETVESQWAMNGNALWEFSPQQVASCTTTCDGCGGGWTTDAYQYLQGTVGLGSAWFAPYIQSMYTECTGTKCTGPCNYSMSSLKTYGQLTGPYAMISGFSYATPACAEGAACNSQNMALLASNVAVYGPASIIVDASTWGDYTGGVLSQAACGGYAFDDLDHAVQLVGFNANASTPYWLVKNSWATNWGLNGYIKLGYPANTCGLGNLATFVSISNNQKMFDM